MMSFVKIRSLSLAVVIGISVTFISLILLGKTSPALAQGHELTGHVNLEPIVQPSEPRIYLTIVFTDPAVHVVQDLAGNTIGEGIHIGDVRCRDDNCNQSIQFDLFTGSGKVGYKYQFKSLQALDSAARRSIVAGTGIIYSGNQKERFLFMATFEDNRDGTVTVTYVASRPDASFRLPNLPSTFEIFSRP